jgi:hypothetical protein
MESMDQGTGGAGVDCPPGRCGAQTPDEPSVTYVACDSETMGLANERFALVDIVSH